MAKSKEAHLQAPDIRPRHFFWPKWQVRVAKVFNDGEMIPKTFTGPQCGTISDQTRSERASDTSTTNRAPLLRQKPLEASKDVMFINNYVFDHCENPNATIYYLPGEGLPQDLQHIQIVAVHASALSVDVKPEGNAWNCQGGEYSPPHEDGDIVWGKQLRFILANFPAVRVILVLTTTVLDMYRPSTCPLPYEVFHQTEAIDADDRRRLGIMEGAAGMKICAATGRAGNFVIQGWDDVKREWPFFHKVSRGLGAQRPSPVLAIAGLVFFAKEWVSMEKNGEHGRSCRIEDMQLPAGPIRTAVRMERGARSRLGEETPRRPVDKRNFKPRPGQTGKSKEDIEKLSMRRAKSAHSLRKGHMKNTGSETHPPLPKNHERRKSR